MKRRGMGGERYYGARNRTRRRGGSGNSADVPRPAGPTEGRVRLGSPASHRVSLAIPPVSAWRAASGYDLATAMPPETAPATCRSSSQRPRGRGSPAARSSSCGGRCTRSTSPSGCRQHTCSRTGQGSSEGSGTALSSFPSSHGAPPVRSQGAPWGWSRSSAQTSSLSV